MASPSQCSQLLLLLVLAIASRTPHFISAAIADEQKKPIPLAGCPVPDMCGDMSIPFPFGMKAGCFLEGFQVSCDKTVNPPRAFLNSTTIVHNIGDRTEKPGAAAVDSKRSFLQVELMNISAAESQAWAYGAIRSNCPTKDGSYILKLQATSMASEGPFVLSPRRNVLVGVGRNVMPKLVRSASIDTTRGYMLACLANSVYSCGENGSCSGQGCCQTSFGTIDPGINLELTSFSVAFGAQNVDTTYARGMPPCSYGMVVASSWYNFSKEDLYGHETMAKKYPSGVPFVLDFAIGTGSCPGQHCSSNSSCANAPGTGKGYTCRCDKFYGGNPYIPDGCKDIDECADPGSNACDKDTTICVNRPLGYDCACKRGMSSRKGDYGPCTERFPLPAKIVVGLSALIVFSVLMFMVHQYIKFKKFYEQNGGPLLKGVKNIRIYTRKQMKQITSNYKHVIGEGAFGQVYKGTLKDKQQVAIKKSIKVDEDRKKEFTDEVIIQSEMRHKNIVRLLGCCLEFDVPMLVYEFVARGSLHDVLFGNRDSVPVDTRLGIAIGSAEGLTYMHSAGESTIRHGDVKSANILLDKNFNPKVSDFGTSSLLATGKAETTERVIGDMSYIDPIYMEQGIVTQKSDVYSFGIVLIELITRRAATYDKKRSYIANFVQACLDNRAREFFDNDITSEDDIKLLAMISGVAVECLKPNPDERLDMKQVEHRLIQITGASSVQHGQERNYQGSLSPSRDDVALLN